MFKQSI